MAKHRTREEKQKAAERRHLVIQEQLSYSLPEVKKASKPTHHAPISHESTFDAATGNYMKKDMIHIASASGIILAFDILLFALLITGTLKLNLLGY